MHIIDVKRGLPIEEADLIAGEVRERIHQSINGEYCIIHVDAAEGTKTNE